MRSVFWGLAVAFIYPFFTPAILSAQGDFNTGLNGMVINLPCNQNCVNQVFQIPHLKTSSDYVVKSIPYNAYPYVTTGGTEDVSIYNDDKYGAIFNLPFPFCFYDSVFNRVSVSSNGVVTFDYGLQACPNVAAPWNITNIIPFNNQTICSGAVNSYPRAAIMGVFMDLDPRPGPAQPTTSSPPDRKIEWRVEGTAPLRRFVVSYYKIGVYEATPCGLNTPAIFQIVIYESTGLIDIFIQNKTCSATSPNGNRAITGIQNWNRDKGLAPPNRNANTPGWTASNEGWRFVPSGPISRFVRSELYLFGGTTMLMKGDTSTTSAGLLDVTFPGFCPPANTEKYVIKTIYSACEDGVTEIIAYDTITVNKTTSLNATSSVTQTSCGITGTGTAMINVPAGLGTAPYSFVLTPTVGPSVTQNGNSPQQFNGLTAGAYSLVVTDASGGCSSTLPLTITSTGALAVNYTVTNTSCKGDSVRNGGINVTPPNGTPPITYTLTRSSPPNAPIVQVGNGNFTGLLFGTYLLVVQDNAGCSATLPITINQGPSLTMTGTSTPSSCPGAFNGSITITAVNGGGTTPYQYSINFGPYQSSPTFNGLAGSPSAYLILMTDAINCTATQGIVVNQGATTVTGTAAAAPTSCNGASNGSITVTPTSGTGPYEYSLNGGSFQTNNIFNGLAANNYTVIIREAGVCNSNPISVTVNSGGPLVATATPAATSCNGAANGTITVNPSNGTGPYTFTLDGTITQTGATTVFINVAAGAHNVVVKDASNCQSASIPVTISQGPALTGAASSTPTTCTGVNNGTITVTTNASGPLLYSLDAGPPQIPNIFTNVSAGTHNVTISSTLGCISGNIPVTVNAGAGITATATTTATSCTGVNNGSVTVTPANGAAPYQYSIDAGANQASNVFNNVSAGTHNIRVTDASGCQFTLGVNVTASTGITASYASVNSSCSGAANGNITVIPAGGVVPYTFVLGTVSQMGNSNTTFGFLTAGTYSILVTDAIGCQFTLSATVVASSGFTANYTPTSTSCAGANNGSITVTPGAGGTGPYTFKLGTTTQTGATSTTFNNLAPGTYSVQITDANGCQFTLNSATVTAGLPLSANVTPISTACPGVSNGSITVTPGNGSGPYTFIMDGTITQTGATSTIFTGVAAGAHNIVINDVNGCSSPLPAVTVASGTGITANVNATSTSCIGATNGGITITPTNGTSPYTFVLNGTTTQTGATTASFTGIAAGGSHSIVVTDAIGCTGTFNNINVAQGSMLTANTITVATSCNGASNGQIKVTPANGSGPYTFTLNGTTTQTGATNTIFTNLAANNYNIVVNDAAGCISNPVSAIVNAGPPITVALAKTDAICYASLTGSLTATPSANATAPIQYSLDNVNWQTIPTFNGLGSTTYMVYIRDAAGCSNSNSIVVGQPAQLAATTAVQSVLCNSQSNGLITVAANGGVGTYSYSIDNVTYQPGNAFNVGAGNYTVYVRDANNCQVQLNNVNVTQPAALSATAITGNATCGGGSDGTITVTATGGASSYQYSSNGTSFQGLNTLNVTPGMYNVTVKDANGCAFIIPNIVVGLTNNLTLTPAIDPGPICQGKSVQLQTITNATQFTWTPALGLSSSTIGNPIASPATPTLYTVTATLGNCTLTDDVFVDVMAAPIPDAGAPGDICYGQTYQLQGSGGVSYSWSPATYLSSTNISNPAVTPDKTVTYSLNVTDANGCTSLIADQVTVNVTPPIKVSVSPADTVVYAGAQVQLLATSAGTSYIWSPATGLNNPNIANPVATAPSSDGSVVIYQVKATTSANCQGDASVRIRVYKGPEIYMVTAFTPNGDGKNETFVPFPVGIKQLNYFRVYNRWGQLLFSTTTLNQGWDGRLGAIEQESGVYIWMIEGVTIDNKIIKKKGTVTLIR